VPEKNRSSRNLLIGVATAMAVVIAALLAVPFLIPAGFIGNRVAALVRQKTGRDLRIAGSVSFSLLPRPGLIAHDVTLASPAGGFSRDFLTAKTVEIALKPLALLHGAVEIEQLRLSQPAIDFEIDVDGRRNWIFRPPLGPATTATAPTPGSAPSFTAFDVTIVEGEASYVDDRTGRKASLGDLAMTLSLPSLDGPLSARGSATYNGQPVKLAVGIASPVELRDGRASAATVDIASLNGNLDFRGTIDGADPLEATGTVNFKTPSLRDFLAWVGIGFTPQDSEFGPLSIDGKIELAGPKLTLTEAAIALDQFAAKGTLVLGEANGRLELDLDDMALYGGKGTGKIVVDSTGTAPTVAANLKLTGITVHELKLNIAGFDTLSGTGDFSSDLTGHGKSMHELVASLAGTGRIAFADGAIGSAGLSPLMKNALGPAIGDRAIPREIAYRTLSATATIAAGVLHNSDLQLSGPQLSATGAGTLDLGPRRIDYLWQPDISGLGSARIAITGAWDNPEYKVESMSITKGLSVPGLKLR